MGSAIACGLAGKEVFKGNITVSDASLPKLEELQKGLPGISICRGNVEACKCADVIILAVKPFMIKNVIEEIRDSLDCKRQIVVSIAAGIGLKALEEFFSGTDGRTPAIFHIIPNTAVKVGAGMSFITYSNADEEAKEKVLEIFGNLQRIKEIFLKPERRGNRPDDQRRENKNKNEAGKKSRHSCF